MILQRHESPDERVLHDVLAVDDRSHETRAIAVQLGPQLRRPGRGARAWRSPVRRGLSCAQAAAPSSMVTPVSPLSPKAKPSAYFGSSSTETTFSPNSRGGIGAPKRGQELFGLHAHGVARRRWRRRRRRPVPPTICCGTIAWKRIPRFFCSETPLAYLAMNQSMRLAPP